MVRKADADLRGCDCNRNALFVKRLPSTVTLHIMGLAPAHARPRAAIRAPAHYFEYPAGSILQRLIDMGTTSRVAPDRFGGRHEICSCSNPNSRFAARPLDARIVFLRARAAAAVHADGSH